MRDALPGSGDHGDIDGQGLDAADMNRLPGGLVDYYNLASAAEVGLSASPGIADIGSVTFTVTPGRIYVVRFTGSAHSTVDGDQVRLLFTNSANVELNRLTQPVRGGGGAAAENRTPFPMVFLLINASAGSTTIKLRGQSLTPSGIPTTAQTGYILAYDEGPIHP